MRTTSLFTLLSVGSAAIAAPITRRTTLDAAAVAEAQVRDDTATRAFSAVPIKTASGLCLSADPESGDFRENLTPVATVECNGSANQTWDVITAGKHNNAPGTALIVSALTQACLNFDPRRAAGNQVLLFSCGGRADGGGAVTDSQQFIFNGGSGPLALSPVNSKNTVCITVNNNLLDQTSCNPATASGNELFTIGDGNGAAAPPPPPASTADATTAAETTTTAAAASTTTAAGVTLDQAAVAEAQVRDDTATRAASNVAIKTSDGKCLTVSATSGDFRENLIPITTATCDGSAGQGWDVITAGKHNDQPGTALFVSTLTQGCMNFDPRRAAGNQVLLFSCGGRADGGGAVTNSQLFTFTSAAAPIPLAPTNQAGTCFFDNNGNLDQQSCNTASPAANQLFTIGDAAPAPAVASTALPAANAGKAKGGKGKGKGKGAKGGKAASTVAAATTVAATNAAPETTTAVATTAAATTTAAGVTLDQAAVAEAQVRDDTATRAASNVAIKTADGKCLTVSATSGDFRENLIPITTATCDGSAGQGWDVITAGKHNDQPGTALFVSTLTQGCMNFDPRRAAGNQVLLFSCGGRADGGGAVTNSQLFTFTSASAPIPLAPTNQAGTCFFDNNGNLDQQSCNTASPAANQLFTIG